MASNSNGFLGKLGLVRSPGAPVPHRKHTTNMETVEMPVPGHCQHLHAAAYWCPMCADG